MSAQQSPEIKFRCSASGSTTSAVFLLEPDSKEAHATLSLTSSKESVESVDLVGDVHVPARSATGFVVRVHNDSKPFWSWSVGSDPSSDLVLPMSDACVKHATIHQLGYEDDDTHQEFATVLERHDDAYIELVDPIGNADNTEPERLDRNRRCLQQLQSLTIGAYRFRVYYPQLTADEKIEHNILFRSVMRIEPRRQIARESLVDLGEVGSGTYGVVYKHINIDTGRNYALKILRDARITKDNKFDRIRRELGTLRKTTSPHIIRSVELENDCTDTEISVLLPFVGGTLQDALDGKAERLSNLQTQDVMYQALQGITYLHTQLKTIHRDIKPSNILLYRKDDGQIVAMVSDLGLAVEYVAGFASSTTGGSVAYCCPGIMAGKHGPRFRSDTYSFGVSYVEAVFPLQYKDVSGMVSNEFNVFSGAWAQTLQDIVQSHNLAGFENWIAAALKKDLEERPTCSELAKAMRAFLSGSLVPDVNAVMAARMPAPPEPFENVPPAQVRAFMDQIIAHEREREAGRSVIAPFEQRAQDMAAQTVTLRLPSGRRR
ncbi:hypothetical protein B9Z65_7219 [Elsinoe australis]|uniref:mitogen-activated protein kinase kinase n=1 Tax=Elsinoe australis TaxID=40998 RepID=A0A2P7Z682_9PEZI|nr:hypothetical protein B9Z65_7219 [Elsinoe australis]